MAISLSKVTRARGHVLSFISINFVLGASFKVN